MADEEIIEETGDEKPEDFVAEKTGVQEPEMTEEQKEAEKRASWNHGLFLRDDGRNVNTGYGFAYFEKRIGIDRKGHYLHLEQEFEWETRGDKHYKGIIKSREIDHPAKEKEELEEAKSRINRQIAELKEQLRQLDTMKKNVEFYRNQSK